MESFLLYVLIGPPGSGKSTYARGAFPADWVVCADDIREARTRWRRDDPKATWKYVAPVRAEVSRAITQALRQRLRAGLPTVYDNTNLLQSNRHALLKLVPKGAQAKYVVLDRPLKDKLASRGWRPESLILQQHEDFQSEWPKILSGDGSDFVAVEDRRILR